MTTGSGIALLLGIAAVLMWAGILARSVWRIGIRNEQRRVFLAMAVIGLVAAVGALSAGVSRAAGELGVVLDEDVLVLLGNMGRGALFMGGLIVWFLPSSREDRR